MNAFITFFITLLGCQFFAYAQDSTYTLDDLLAEGINTNYDIRLAQLSETSSLEELRMARQAFYPNLYGNVSNNLSFGRYIDPYTYLYSNQSNYYNAASLNSSLLLYQGSKNINSLKAAKNKLEASKLTLQSRQMFIKESIIISFINIDLLKALIANNQERLNLSLEEQERMDQLYNAGKISKTILLDLNAQKAVVETEMIDLRKRLWNESLRLGLLVSRENIDPLLLKPIDIGSQKVEDSSAYSVQNHPDYQLQLENVKYYHARMNVAKSAISPVLSLNGTIYSGYSSNRTRFDASGRSIDYPFPVQFSDNFYQLITLNLSVPIYANGINKNIKRQGIITYQQAEVSKDKRILELNNQFAMEHQQIIASSEQVKLTQKKNEEMEQAFELIKTQFFAGRTGSFEYVYRKQQLFESKELLINDQYSFVLNNKLFELHFSGKK